MKLSFRCILLTLALVLSTAISPLLATDLQSCASSALKTGQNSGHSLWLPGIGKDFIFSPGPGEFVETANGEARLSGVVRRASNPNEAFRVDVLLGSSTKQAPQGSPKKELSSQLYVENGGPIDTATWSYYEQMVGTLTGLGDLEGAVIELTRRGPAFQIGVGASGKNTNYGAATWLDWTVVSQPNQGYLQTSGHGDFNLDLVDCANCWKAPKPMFL